MDLVDQTGAHCGDILWLEKWPWIRKWMIRVATVTTKAHEYVCLFSIFFFWWRNILQLLYVSIYSTRNLFLREAQAEPFSSVYFQCCIIVLVQSERIDPDFISNVLLMAVAQWDLEACDIEKTNSLFLYIIVQSVSLFSNNPD